MNTNQLNDIVQRDRIARQQFQGVYPSDRLPEKISRYPSAFIANVDPSSKPGSHWVAFYFTEAPVYYSRNFKTFLELNSKEWICNQKQLQGLNSNVCGQYCFYYVVNRCRGNSLSSIIQPFVKNKKINDAFVDEFVNKYFPFLHVESNIVKPRQVSFPNKREVKQKKKDTE